MDERLCSLLRSRRRGEAGGYEAELGAKGKMNLGSILRRLSGRRDGEARSAPSAPVAVELDAFGYPYPPPVEVTRKKSEIDWEAKRWELGLPEGERLYAGFVAARPNVYVVPHFNRLRQPGMPVWADGRQLEKRLFLREGTMHRTPWGNVNRETAHELDSFFGGARSIYELDEDGLLELAMNLLLDACGEVTARRRYQDFRREVLSRLVEDRDWASEFSEVPEHELPEEAFEALIDTPPEPHVYFQPRERVDRRRLSEWFLPESTILGWVRG
jgi:hypothetical protein